MAATRPPPTGRRPHPSQGRSFAARAREVPPSHQPEVPSLSEDYPPNPADTTHEPNYVVHGNDIQKAPPAGPADQRAHSRRASTKDQKHGWAHDRSPLQKLEVTFDGISKEEKRARVQEAEMKAQERLARKMAESDTGQVPQAVPRHVPATENMSPKAANLDRAASNRRPNHGQSATPRSRDIQVTKRPQFEQQTGPQQRAPEGKRRPDPRAHNRAQSIHNPAFRPAYQPQSADEQPGMVRTGSVPRRSVTVSNRPGAHASQETRNFPQDATVPGTQARELPVTKTSERISPRREQQYDSSRRTSQIRQPLSAEIGGQGLRPDTYPAPAEGGSGLPSANADQPEHRVNPPDFQNGNTQSKPKRQTVSFNVPPPTPPPLLEWKNAPTARLGASDFDFQNFDVGRSKAWWERGESSDRRKSRALPNEYQKPAPKPMSSNTFQPRMFMKCGPLLRYTGMRRTQVDGPNGSFDKETWRGSIMIVTKDSRSSYESPPTLRLFSQPMNLLPPPPTEVRSAEGAKLAPEYVDPTAGLLKLGRDGRPLYIKPVDHTEEEMDLSFVENDEGIYELSPSLIDYSSEGTKQPIPANRVHSTDGESVGAYKEISGVRLYADPDRDVTFWRFSIEVDLTQTEQRIAYRLNQGPALGFWVPAQGQPMNIMYNTCNGFSPAVDSDKFCGPDPLWRDVINEHQTRPFHVMIGGGDQIFNDRVVEESLYLQEWIKLKNINDKYNYPFGVDFRSELENFYLENYSAWFSQGLFSFANSQIPMVNIWNDHEIIEGFGSYPDEFMGTPVLSGLGRIAFKYYLLFQHHSVVEETEADEPSWLLGAHLGPYINQKSRSVFLSLGKGVSFLGLDCRTERMSNEILCEPTCDLVWDRCHREIVKGETKHLIVLLSVPIAYPRVAPLKNILNSRKSLGKAGMFGGFINKHGGNIAIHDDHWTAKHHKDERTWLIEDLQDLAAEKSVRVTILSGDVHLAAIGQFNSNPKLDLAKDRDCRYMPNIISSTIANAPETEMISDMLNKRNRVHHMDSNTDEEVIPIFTHDVDGKPRNNKRLLPRRNWCSIREYQPGTTPPGTPDSEPSPDPTEPRPGMLKRTLSLTRGDRPQAGGSGGGNGFLRRLSLRGPPPTREFSLNRNTRRMSMDGPFPPPESGDSYFPQRPTSSPSQEPPQPRPGPFLRRPTNLSQKATKKSRQGDDGVGGYVNLEGGLAVTLNLEVNPRDPSGITAPYKLLVPALRCDGSEYDPPPTRVAKGWKKWLSVRKERRTGEGDGDDSDESDDEAMDDDEQGEYEAEEVPSETLVPMKQHGEDGDVKGFRKWFGRGRHG